MLAATTSHGPQGRLAVPGLVVRFRKPMVHRSEHLLVVHAPLLPGRLVLCVVIRGMLEKC